MASKRKILESLTRQTLLAIAAQHDVTGLSGKAKGDIVAALSFARRVSIEEALSMLPRDDLKAACRGLGLDDAGREKQTLIERLLGRDKDDDSPATPNARDSAMAKRKKTEDNTSDLFGVADYRHDSSKRKNNPPAKIAAEGTVPAMSKIDYSYSPRRSPTLQFDSTGRSDALPELLAEATQRPLTPEEARQVAEALRHQEPWLEWAGKREQQAHGFSVDPVALHIHERVSAQAILRIAARKDVERSLFGDPEQAYHEAVQFYRHDIDWTNRLILGDSLQVMASLARREDLAGKVQMIYIDPPYGIKFASNFQPRVARSGVTDNEVDLTRELEVVKAYRDTWHLGIHSYLAYLANRVTVARELLADTGSIFIQMGDENVHRVRQLLEEVFGADNYVGTIAYKTAIGMTGELLDCVYDQVIWFARIREKMTYNRLFLELAVGKEGATRYKQVESRLTGEQRLMTPEERESPEQLADDWRPYRDQGLTSRSGSNTTTFSINFSARTFRPSSGGWRTNEVGMNRVEKSERLLVTGNNVSYKKFFKDSPALALTNFWTDTGGGITSRSDPKVYVVQTHNAIIQRCMLMSTKPGDLVLDPTCGSGTTAYVAEQWGRRWITIDTSRVAVAIARQRIATAKFERYRVKGEDPCGNGNGDRRPGIDPYPGFAYATVPHVTLKSIAQNTNLDPIFAKHEPILDERLTTCNAALRQVTDDVRQKLAVKFIDKHRKEGKRALTDADHRRWELPSKGPKWEHWEVPFDSDRDWPRDLRDAVTAYRKAWCAKMDEVNACIAANAEQEDLVDRPEVIKDIIRVSGPFTVEAVQPPELSLGEVVYEGTFGGEPDELESTFQMRVVEPRGDFEVKNVEAYLDQMTRLLRVDGVRFPNNKQNNFSRLERTSGTEGGIHAGGRWTPAGQTDSDPDGKATVAVAFGLSRLR